MRRLQIGLILVSVLVAVFTLSSFSFAGDSFSEDFPEEVIKSSRYVVKIKITTFIKGRWGSFRAQGSGFFVAPNKILTASHIGGSLKELFTHQFSIRWVEIRGRDYLAKVIGIDFSRELALLEIKEGFSSYVLEFAEPEVADVVYFIGFSGYSKKVFSGKIEDLNGNTLSIIPEGPKEKFTPSGEVMPGMSGGPILDRDGKVVGLIWGKWFQTDKVGATPIEEIKEFLEENKDK